MAFCGNCGTQVEDNAGFCPSCGGPVGAAQAAPPAAAQAADPAQDAADNKLMAILAYILFFIPLITGDAKKSPFVKYHTNQGIVLIITSVVCTIAANIIGAIFSALHIYFLGWLLSSVVGLAVLALMIIGILGANKGEMKPLPVIGKITILK